MNPNLSIRSPIPLLISAAGVLLLIILRMRRRPYRSQPTCGRCGYAVTGLPGDVCPECGSSLKEVGVVPPGTERIHRGQFALAWLLVVAPLAWVLTPAIVSLLPVLRNEHFTVDITPRSGAYTVGIFSAATGIWQRSPEVVKLMLNPPNQITVIVEVRPASGGYTYPDVQWKPVNADHGFDHRVILRAMETGRIDTSDTRVVGEARQLESMIGAIARGDGTVSTGNQFIAGRDTNLHRRTTTYYSPLHFAGVYAAWGVVWIVGLLVLRRWRWLHDQKPSRAALDESALLPITPRP